MYPVMRGVASALGSVVGSWTAGNLMWVALDLQVERINKWYDTSMSSLIRQLNPHIEEKSIAGIVRDIKHFGTSSELICCPSKGPYFCSQKNHSRIRQQIAQLSSQFNTQVHRWAGLPGHEIKWMLLSVITGIAAAALSNYLLIPSNTALYFRSITLLISSLTGSLAAASSTLSRVGGCGSAAD